MSDIFHPEDFIIRQYAIPPGLHTLKLSAEAPSNIALVKYWGKKAEAEQIPMNPSVSFTLSRSKTTTQASLNLKKHPEKAPHLTFYLDGEHKPSFETKIRTFLERIRPYAPFVWDYDWVWHSHNTFPHGSGIASSASGFAALAGLIMQLEEKIFGIRNNAFRRAKTSFLARLGSGSAARSVAAPAMIWGRYAGVKTATDWYAVPLPFALHPDFEDVRDTIILFEQGQKAVSSTQGHRLIHNHPFKHERIQQAHRHMDGLLEALRTGDWDTFGRITEAEALMLHALMMTSEPYYILMRPETLGFIQSLWNWRLIWEEQQHERPPVYFSLDAGANVHLLYPGHWHTRVMEWLHATVPDIMSHNAYIADSVAKE